MCKYEKLGKKLVKIFLQWPVRKIQCHGQKRKAKQFLASFYVYIK